MYNKHKQPNTTKRISLLKELIKDCIGLGFAKIIILGYQQQLNILQHELQHDKNKRKLWKAKQKVKDKTK